MFVIISIPVYFAMLYLCSYTVFWLDKKCRYISLTNCNSFRQQTSCKEILLLLLLKQNSTLL